EELHAEPLEPLALLTGRELQVRLGPPARPLVLVTVEPGRARPVLAGQLEGVRDPHAPLLGRVDEEQPTERPPRLPAETGLRLLVDYRDALARVHEFGGGNEARKARPDDERVAVWGAVLGHPDSFVVPALHHSGVLVTGV